MSLALYILGCVLTVPAIGCLYAPLVGPRICCPPPRWHHRAMLAGVGLIVAATTLMLLGALL